MKGQKENESCHEQVNAVDTGSVSIVAVVTASCSSV